MRILVVDIGNTSTQLGAYEKGWKFRAVLSTEGDPRPWLNLLLKSECPLAIVSSVVPNVTERWMEAIRKFAKRSYLFRYSEDLGIKVIYAEPNRLGTDRLANALYVAHHLKENTVVADIGTAITVDAIGHDGTFFGGAILPGLEPSLNSLVSSTAQLTYSDTFRSARLPGRSTRECISLGILRGTVHGILGIANEMADHLKWKRWRGIMTGGASSPLVPFFSERNWSWNPSLTLEGLIVALERIRECKGPDSKRP